MRKFHITYYIRTDEQRGILLSGVTIEADDMRSAINLFCKLHDEIGIHKIKYVVEL
jgi:hypothetical protein